MILLELSLVVNMYPSMDKIPSLKIVYIFSNIENLHKLNKLRFSCTPITIFLLIRNIPPAFFTRKYPCLKLNRFNSVMDIA